MLETNTCLVFCNVLQYGAIGITLVLFYYGKIHTGNVSISPFLSTQFNVCYLVEHTHCCVAMITICLSL